MRSFRIQRFAKIFFVATALFSTSIAQSKEAAMKPSEVCPILVSETIPNVTLVDSAGKKASLHDIASSSSTLVIFYRGSWCPYCNTHLADLRNIESDLRDMGIKVVAISPDKPEYLNVTLDKQKIAYTLLSDSKMEAAKAFGVAYKVDEDTLNTLKGYDISLTKNSGENHQMLPVPAAFLVDQDLKVKFSFVAPDYTDRKSVV